MGRSIIPGFTPDGFALEIFSRGWPSFARFAAAAGLPRATVNRWALGLRSPRPKPYGRALAVLADPDRYVSCPKTRVMVCPDCHGHGIRPK